MIRYAKIGSDLIAVREEYNHIPSQTLRDIFSYEFIYEMASLNKGYLIDFILDAAANGVSMWRINQMLDGYGISMAEISVRTESQGLYVYKKAENSYTATLVRDQKPFYGYGKTAFYAIIAVVQAVIHNENSRTFNP